MVELVLNSGFVGIIIGILFVLAIGIFIERVIVFRNASSDAEAFADEFDEAIRGSDYDKAIEICDEYGGEHGAGVPEVYRIAIEHSSLGPATLRNVLDNHIELIVVPRLRARLGLLGTVARVAPMLGLIGTVSGMIGAFGTIAGATGAGVEPAALAGDIGMALGTTFLGLLVAIPIVFAITYLKARIEKLEIDLDRYSQKCLDVMFPSNPPTIAPNKRPSMATGEARA
ncbi:MotA/TolQ/ExbB proton channel family protein [Stieleria varia]|uniref:Colicin uptake protein TolQ n=1 Tax=Stieleria varia TaxID=2528005 RepID=A0A5C6B2Z4_9BACT|nr:MotA/TolQ/ExbB proton channel family protein [Stieleria varia]TWU05616.1 colicin uptake protein TolQ [Stieleria varia]